MAVGPASWRGRAGGATLPRWSR